MNAPSSIMAKLAKLVVPDEEAARRRLASDQRDFENRCCDLWNRADVPQRHAEARCGDLWNRADVPQRHAEARTEAIDAAHPWAKTRDRVAGMLGRGFTLCLTGARGNGKTQIGVECIRRVTNQGKVSRFISAQRVFMLFKGTFDDGAKQTEVQVLDSLRRPALLVIDEIGQRTESAWENRTFFELLNARYNDMTDTILTANLDPEELATNLGPSIISRMQEGGGILKCDWASFRK